MTNACRRLFATLEVLWPLFPLIPVVPKFPLTETDERGYVSGDIVQGAQARREREKSRKEKRNQDCARLFC